MIAYFNGEYKPLNEIAIPVTDLGFTMGVTVTEQIRTNNRKLFLLDRHLERFFCGVRTVGFRIRQNRSELNEIISKVVLSNAISANPDHEMGIGVCATPGTSPKFLPDEVPGKPNLLVYAYAIDPKKTNQQRAAGVNLRTVDVCEVPAASVPKSLKCRSRMHYYLAERKSENLETGSRPLLLDADGFVAESSTASVVLLLGNTMIAPPVEDILESISLGFAFEVAKTIGMKTERRKFKLDELCSAEEVFWLSTTTGALPVVRIDGKDIGDGKPGAGYLRLLEGWDRHVVG